MAENRKFIRRIADCNNVTDLRVLAKRNLPWPIFNYMDGGADDEITLRRNTDAFADYELLPTQLSDISNVNLRTTVLGCDIEWPVFAPLIVAIKHTRRATGMGLKDAKDLVDGAPATVLEAVDQETANKAKEVLEAAGATVELK